VTAVPFGDLKAHVSALRPEIDAAQRLEGRDVSGCNVERLNDISLAL